MLSILNQGQQDQLHQPQIFSEDVILQIQVEFSICYLAQLSLTLVHSSFRTRLHREETFIVMVAHCHLQAQYSQTL
jgi:hypothetical protein